MKFEHLNKLTLAVSLIFTILILFVEYKTQLKIYHPNLPKLINVTTEHTKDLLKNDTLTHQYKLSINSMLKYLKITQDLYIDIIFNNTIANGLIRDAIITNKNIIDADTLDNLKKISKSYNYINKIIKLNGLIKGNDGFNNRSNGGIKWED